MRQETLYAWNGPDRADAGRNAPFRDEGRATPVPPRKVTFSGYGATRRDFADIIYEKAARRAAPHGGDRSAREAPVRTKARPRRGAGVSAWDVWDFLVVAGALLLLAGLIVPFLSDRRALGALVPVGAALIAFGGYRSRARADDP